MSARWFWSSLTVNSRKQSPSPGGGCCNRTQPLLPAEGVVKGCDPFSLRRGKVRGQAGTSNQRYIIRRAGSNMTPSGTVTVARKARNSSGYQNTKAVSSIPVTCSMAPRHVSGAGSAVAVQKVSRGDASSGMRKMQRRKCCVTRWKSLKYVSATWNDKAWWNLYSASLNVVRDWEGLDAKAWRPCDVSLHSMPWPTTWAGQWPCGRGISRLFSAGYCLPSGAGHDKVRCRYFQKEVFINRCPATSSPSWFSCDGGKSPKYCWQVLFTTPSEGEGDAPFYNTLRWERGVCGTAVNRGINGGRFFLCRLLSQRERIRLLLLPGGEQ